MSVFDTNKQETLSLPINQHFLQKIGFQLVDGRNEYVLYLCTLHMPDLEQLINPTYKDIFKHRVIKVYPHEDKDSIVLWREQDDHHEEFIHVSDLKSLVNYLYSKSKYFEKAYQQYGK